MWFVWRLRVCGHVAARLSHGGTIHTGAVRCLDCNGYGEAAQPVAIDLEAVNAELAAAAFYDQTGIEYAETVEVAPDWNSERQAASRELAAIDRVLGRHFARAAGKFRDPNAPNGKPNAAIIAPLEERRAEIDEWWQHSIYASAATGPISLSRTNSAYELVRWLRSSRPTI